MVETMGEMQNYIKKYIHVYVIGRAEVWKEKKFATPTVGEVFPGVEPQPHPTDFLRHANQCAVNIVAKSCEKNCKI
jgi:hypothetical protein